MWGLKKEGALLVIIWSLSTTPASHSPTPEGSRPCCVYHRPPMDSLKSDRNKRQDCALPLPRIYLRLTLLTSTLHVSQKNKLYSWLSLCVFIIKCCIKMLTKKKAAYTLLFYSVLQGLVNCPTRGGIFTMSFHSTFLQPLFKQCVFGFWKNVFMSKR